MQLFAFAAGGNHTSRTQDSQMLREIGFRDSQSFLQFRRPPLAARQHLHQLQASGVGERFTDDRLPFIDFMFAIRLPSCSHTVPQGVRSSVYLCSFPLRDPCAKRSDCAEHASEKQSLGFEIKFSDS